MGDRGDIIRKANEEEICCGRGVEWDRDVVPDARPTNSDSLYGTCGRCSRRLYIDEGGTAWIQLDDVDWKLNAKTF